MHILSTILSLIGSLGLLLYGMKLMSDGVQKSAGETLQRILARITGNRFLAVLTGMGVTAIIQSSGATTVMVVSFVNAGLLSLQQSIGVIFGANIGTTVTAWIVAIFGFSFKISAFAIPIFGIGYFLTFFKKIHQENLGEALMGFGLLFLGLSLLSSAVSVDASQLTFLGGVQNLGFASILLGLFVGILLTVLLHSSSASTAVILTLAYNNVLTWEFSVAMVLGSNIGSTIDSILAAVGTKVNARRAALVHVMFNVIGTLLALAFFKPLIWVVDFIVPGEIKSNITYHISALHTIFNIVVTLIFLPFTNQIAALTEKIIKPRADEKRDIYKLEFTELTGKETPAAHIIRVEKEIADMTDVATEMFDRIQIGLQKRDKSFIEGSLPIIERSENYADQMHEQIARYLVHVEHLSVTERQVFSISNMIQIVDELESMTDECFCIGMLIKRSIEKKMTFAQDDTDRLIPYLELVRQFLQFIRININKHLDADKLSMATELEGQIDLFRKNLKKVARKRLESGADVKSELLYIDVVRHIEKIGDRAFTISEILGQA